MNIVEEKLLRWCLAEDDFFQARSLRSLCLFLPQKKQSLLTLLYLVCVSNMITAEMRLQPPSSQSE